MPSRILRDGVSESMAVNNLPWEAELFYRRLMSVVDDYGRYSALPQLLVSRCYPLQVEKVTKAQVSKWMKLCSAQGLIVLYESVEGKPLLEIQHFNQRTRTSSKFPANLGTSGKCITNDGHMTAVCVDEVEDEDDSKPKTKARKRPHSIPDDWKPNSNHATIAEEEGVNLERAALDFADWAVGGGKTYVCWDRTFSRGLRGWLGNSAKNKQTSGVTLDPLGKPLKEWK